jgi:hypothetical protein
MTGMLRRINPLLVFGSAVAATVTVVAALVSTQAAPARFHVAHLSPDAPAIDVYVDNVLVESGLTFGQVGPVQTNGKSGPMTVAVRLAGTSPTAVPVLTAEVILNPGTTYIVAVANELARLQIGHYPVPTAGMVAAHGRVQVLHAIPEGPRLDVTTGQAVSIVDGLGYLEDPPYKDLPDGQYRLLGTTETDPSVLAFDETYTFEANTVYTLIVTGQPITTILVATQP